MWNKDKQNWLGTRKIVREEISLIMKDEDR